MAQFDSVALPPRIPLVILPSNRGHTTNKDARLINCYIEVNKNGELDIYKRPGMVQQSVVLADALGRGLWFWEGDVYAIFNGSLYVNGIEQATGLDQTGGVYRFDSILGSNPKLIITNGKKSYSYNNTDGLSGAFDGIDTDFPNQTVKGWAYLNGYSYAMTSDARIFQSELNSVDTVTSWNPLNTIVAQIEPDKGVFLAKQLVYVVALKEWTIEYFFDAGNSVGSTLGSVQGMKVNYGCASADSVQRINDVLVFVCTSQGAMPQVCMLNQGQLTIVSTEAIDRLLAVADFSIVYSWQLAINGHSFYALTFKNSNITLVYDIAQDLWHQWTDENGNYLPIVASTYDSQKRHILQHENSGELLYINSTYYSDNGVAITVDIYTPNWDAGTYNKKQLKRLSIVADQQPGSQLQIRYSNNDYQTWSTFRTFDLSQQQPMLTDWGTFRKRAFHLRHTANTPFRIRAIEASFDIGLL